MVRALTIAAALIALAVGAFAVGRQTGNSNDYADEAAAVFAKPDTLKTTLTGTGTGSSWSPGHQRNKAVVVGDGLPDPGPARPTSCG